MDRPDMDTLEQFFLIAFENSTTMSKKGIDDVLGLIDFTRGMEDRVAELEEPQVGIVRCPNCDEEHDVQLSRGRTNDPNRPDQSGEVGS